MFNCDKVKMEDILQKFYRVGGKISAIIVDEDFTSLNLPKTLCLVSTILYVFCISVIGRVIFQFIQLNVTTFQFTEFHEHVANFSYKNRMKDDENMSQIDKLLPQTLEKYIATLFDRQVRSSWSATRRSLIIPDIIHKEITCDVYWDALKHVELFYDMPAHFLRYVSTLVVHQFYTEGEPIYTRSENMTKLVFIMNGIVKVHSEVNGETPIISFTNGTVLGASTLALSRNSSTYVTCHTFCETVELHRKDFIKACVKYPNYVHDITAMIMNRCNKARDYLMMCKFQRQIKVVEEHSDLLSIRYIKHKLRLLLGKDIEKVNTQQIWSYDDQLILENEQRGIFCSEFIRNYVITKDQDLDPDINFLRRGFYFKFRQESPVLLVWNYMIVVLALITGVVLPYYTCYVQRTTGAYIIFLFSITTVWFLDMMLQLVTGVVTADHTCIEFFDLFKFRMGTLTFIVDIVACIPFGVLIYALEGDIAQKTRLLLQLNRTLKLYRFVKLCEQHHWSSIRAKLYIKYVKHYVLCAYFVYMIAAILHGCLKIQLEKDQRTPYNYLTKSFLFALQILAGVDAHTSNDVSPIITVWPLIAIQILVISHRIYIVSDIASSEALCEIRNSQFSSFCGRLKLNIECFKLDKMAEKRLWANVELQWKDNQGEYILNKRPLRDLSVRLHELLNYSAFGHHLHKMQLLKDLPDNIIRDLCLNIDIRLIPCDERVTNAGDNAREMFLILQGFCGRLDANGKICADILKPGNCISVIEMLYDFRSVCTVVTLTDCKMAIFERNKFINTMTRYPDFLDGIMETLWCSVTRAELEDIVKRRSGTVKNQVQLKTKQNFYKYKYFLPHGSKAYYSYMYPFPRRLNFLRYFVLRMTICNNGTFIFYYEIVRCIFAYLTVFLGSFAALTNCSGMHFELLFNCLDATAWIDIIVRHYICFYDSRNVQERHPAITIAYYWTHGFLIDLFGVIPFDFFVNSKRRLKNTTPLAIYVWNRCLQLYRPYFFRKHIKYITNNMWLVSCILDFLQVLIITILLNQFFNCFNGLEYQISSDQFSEEFHKELHNLVVTASLFLNVGYKPVQSVHNDFIIVILIGLGQFYFAATIAQTIGINLFCNVDITTYQEKMTQLVKFLNYRRIDKNIKVEIIKHFEYIWLKRRGMVIHESIATFNTAFKQDILYAVYGHAVKRSSVFPDAPKAFIQTFLLHVQHVTFLKRAIIYRINDVHGLIYFIFKGKVDVLGADKCILTTLPAGSFFGCLDRCLQARQTVMMVAKGHCEILTINSLDFHKILVNFRDLQKVFREWISIHVDYIHGDCTGANGLTKHLKTSPSIPSLESSLTSGRRRSNLILPFNKCKRLRRILNKLRSVNTSQKFHSRWSLAIAILTFIFFIVEIYQKVTLQTNVALIVTLYISDLMILYKIYTEFHLAVQDEYGKVITTRLHIGRTYRKAYMGLYYDIITVIPLELLVVPFVSSKEEFFTGFRCNRLLRIIICFNYIYKQSMKLNVNVYLMRMIKALLMIFTVQQFTIIFLVRNALMEMEKNLFLRYLKVNATCVEILSLLLVPAAIIEGNCWYKLFILIKMAYMRICILYFMEACTTALFMSRHNSFIYWKFTDRLSTFMTRLKISKPLYDRVIAYVKLFWVCQKGIKFPEFLNDAPYYLREAVLNSMFGLQIQKQHLLGQLHVDLLRQMVAQLQTKTFFTGDFVTFVGDIDETMYFVHEGEIVALSEDNLYEETVAATFNPGDMFGLEQGILKRKGHDYTYRATKYTVLLLLTKSHWFYLIDFFPASKELLLSTTDMGQSDLSLLERYDTRSRSFSFVFKGKKN